MKEGGNEGTKGQMTKKEVSKIEKVFQKYGKASMYIFLKRSRKKTPEFLLALKIFFSRVIHPITIHPITPRSDLISH